MDFTKNVFRLVEVSGNRFIDIVFDTTSMFSEGFPQCAAGLADALTRKRGVRFDATFPVDKVD